MVEPINIYFDTIIQFLKNNPREFHVLILINLLTSKKGKEAINKYSENISKKATTNDIIIKYIILEGSLFIFSFPNKRFRKY